MDLIVISLALSLVITTILEFAPALFVKNKAGWLKISILCNVITNPVLNLILFLFYDAHFTETAILVVVLIGEIMVLIIESNIYKRVLNVPIKVCYIYSAVANALSFVIGSVIWILICDFVLGLIKPQTSVIVLPEFIV